MTGKTGKSRKVSEKTVITGKTDTPRRLKVKLAEQAGAVGLSHGETTPHSSDADRPFPDQIRPILPT